LEETCIKALIYDPTLIHYIDRAFRGFELACLHPEDFRHTDHKEIFKLVKQSLDQDDEIPLDYVRNHLPDALTESLLNDPSDDTYPDWRLEPNAPILESLVNMFIRLRRTRIDEGLDQLVFLQSQDIQQDGEILYDFKKIALEYVQVRGKLDQALQQSTAHGKPKF
jgi:hypothetical protein